MITDNFWQNLKEVVNFSGFDEDKYDSQPGRLADKAFIDSSLNEIFTKQTTKHWLDLLNEKRIPCAPVNKFSDAFSDEQVLHRNMIIDLKHPNGASSKGPGNPIKLSRTNEESFSSPPLLGQHTHSVLSDILNYSEEAIEDLKNNGVVG